MADVGMPGYTQYEEIMGMNPIAAGMAMKQLGLAEQFQQRGLEQEAEKTKAAQLANIFAEKQNPLLLEQQRQQNLERTYGLPAKRIASETAVGTEKQTKEKALQDALLGLKESELKTLDTQAELWARDFTNPERQKQGLALLQLSPEIRKLKLQHEQAMAKERFSQGETTKRTGMTIAAQKERAAGKIPAGGGTLAQRIAGAKSYTHKASIYESAALEAEERGDDLAAEMHRKAAALSRQQDKEARAAAAEVQAGRDISLEELEAGKLRRQRDIAAGKQPASSVVRQPSQQAPSLPPGWTIK